MSRFDLFRALRAAALLGLLAGLVAAAVAA